MARAGATGVQDLGSDKTIWVLPEFFWIPVDGSEIR